jgi:hypothetical protein
VFFPKNIAQRKIAEKRGEGSVEFISLWRTDIGFDWTRQRTPTARNGIELAYTDANKTAIFTAKAVPAKMNYELVFWSKDLDKMTQAIEAYLMWKQVYPNIVLYYNDLYEMNLYMKFGNVVDRSDYNIYEKGLYFVYSMPIEVEGWILTNFSPKTILSIVVDVYYREGEIPNTTDTLLREFTVTETS